jgi:dTDP-4-amino-4,6-dideoxygalactose transaminase
MIPFNKPLVLGNEQDYITRAIINNKLSGDGEYTKLSNSLLENMSGSKKVLLTTSCTHAIELSSLLLNIKPGDEVIMPSYTFVSTANPFILRGAKVVFVDIRPDTMNIDETLIEAAITEKTVAIVPVHYAGVSCEMDRINELAKKYNLFIIEDAAQGVMSFYKGKMLGSIGDIGAYSFHDTKNYNCGEGGAILINNNELFEDSEIIREKGTNRSKFLRGQIDKYSWVNIGSSYLPSEINAAFLYPQLLFASEVNDKRRLLWKRYYDNLLGLDIDLPYVPDYCEHNAHMFYIKLYDINHRHKLISFLNECGIQSVFHYVPLHSSVAGRKYSVFFGKDVYTTKESERLLRLPLYYDMTIDQVDYVCEKIRDFIIK